MVQPLPYLLIAALSVGTAFAQAPPPGGMPLRLEAPALPARLPALSGNSGRALGDPMECLVEPSLITSLGSPVEGTLHEVLVERGSVVTQGQEIARLHSKVEEASVRLKAAQEEFARRRVERSEELFKNQLISASERDELETQMRLAGLELAQQRQVLEQRTIRSPVNGVVVERMLAPGERVGDGRIVKIARIDPLNVEVIAPVELLGRIRVGMSGDVRFGSQLPGSYRASVVVVDRVVDAASGTFGVRLHLANSEGRIPAGIKCTVRFQR